MPKEKEKEERATVHVLALSYLPWFISTLFFSFPICSLFQQAGLGGLHRWLSCSLYSDRFSPQDPLQEIRMWEENGLRVFSFLTPFLQSHTWLAATWRPLFSGQSALPDPPLTHTERENSLADPDLVSVPVLSGAWLCNPMNCVALQAPLSMEFSRKE